MLDQKKHFLRQRQKDVISAMISSAYPLGPGGVPQSPLPASSDQATAVTWRLLVYDDVGRSIIAPLLRVGDLRELGVTLYMHIKQKRDPVPGAPVVYFCAPTEENTDIIASDAINELYEWMYVNFTAQVTRHGLELFAEKLTRGELQSIQHIKVFDRTLNYISLEDDLFVLMQKNSFITLNSRHVKEEEVDAHLGEIVLGISHILISQQVLPVIVHSRTGAAEEVAKRLSVCLNDHLTDRTLTPAASNALGRPLLLIVDRTSDLATLLHHPFSYRGLLVDVGNMHLNKVSVVGEDGKTNSFEIDPDRDGFYRANSFLDFSAVGDNINMAVKKYGEEYAALSGTSCSTEEADASSVSMLLANAPKLSEEKRMLDAHTKMAYCLLHHIRQNQLDRFHGVELGLLRREEADHEELAKLLLSKSGTLEDRQRLYLLAYLTDTQGAHEALLQQCLSAFGGSPFPALTYVKRLRSWCPGAATPSGVEPGAAQGFTWGLAQTLAKNIVNSLGSNAKSELPLTKLVDALMQDSSAASGASTGRSAGASNLRTELLGTVVGYDPRTKKAVNINEMHFSQAIVFNIGGGCVAEYEDLKRWEASHPRKAVSYGCTSLLTGNEALQQLTVLGQDLP
ncbi:putative Sec1 family [Trypanosoma vivax]|uniref:Putative sec1 family transport protein n=1 Tax=Trypanosoma vivax (strain Y486) TaxID=1055687 RepID=G0U1R5_TRYVY|nr:putative sec1 family transport protein [Trypanosoma vivax]KAH8618784.1 putative Sec1 family [Trypanosoma vivax]CCC50214.1 putative sec1 family transport protein [Trypanosoma vivax Y486]